MSEIKLKRKDILYPELSYAIMGCAFEVFNQLGPGHAEKTYHKGMIESFKEGKVPFKSQVYFPVMFKDKIIGRSVFDFLVDEKIIVEIKKDIRFAKAHLDQVLNYLKVSNLQLAILINFTNNGVSSKRIINVSEKT